MKKLVSTIVVIAASMAMATTAFAGTWKTGAARPDLTVGPAS